MEVDDNIEDDPALEMPEDNQGPESIVPSQSTTTEGKKNDFQGKGKAKQQCISRLYKCITYSTLQEQIKAPKLRRLLWPRQNLLNVANLTRVKKNLAHGNFNCGNPTTSQRLHFSTSLLMTTFRCVPRGMSYSSVLTLVAFTLFVTFSI